MLNYKNYNSRLRRSRVFAILPEMEAERMVRLSVAVRCVVLLLVCAVGRFSFAAGTEGRCSSSLSVTSSATNVVDFGGACVGGYARFSVVRRQCAEGRPPVLRIAYATHPDGLGPKGDFCRETAAR